METAWKIIPERLGSSLPLKIKINGAAGLCARECARTSRGEGERRELLVRSCNCTEEESKGPAGIWQ